MQSTRRDVLKAGAGLAACWLAGPNPAPACARPAARAAAGQPAAAAPQPAEAPAQPPGGRKRIPIGLQLYSVREDCAKDLPAVLAAVARMGYQGVEFAGYYGRSAAEMKKLLDDHGLKCCGTHTGLDTLAADKFAQTAECSQTLGNKYLIVPSLPAENTRSAEALLATARLFTELAARARPLGLHVGYHAHAGDFKRIDGRTVWEIIFDNAGPDVAMQMDTGNCLAGGADPVALLQKYPGRSRTIHLKEHGGERGAPIGAGDVKWADVLRVCETTGGTEWYIVEHEVYADPPLESVRKCLEGLKRIG